jgi:hypothetical protein
VVSEAKAHRVSNDSIDPVVLLNRCCFDRLGGKNPHPVEFAAAGQHGVQPGNRAGGEDPGHCRNLGLVHVVGGEQFVEAADEKRVDRLREIGFQAEGRREASNSRNCRVHIVEAEGPHPKPCDSVHLRCRGTYEQAIKLQGCSQFLVDEVTEVHS